MARTTPVNAGYTILNGEGTGLTGYRIDVWAEYLAGAPDYEANTTPLTVYFYAALRPDQSSGTYANYGLNSTLAVNGTSGTGVSSGAYDFRSQEIINFLGSFSGNILHEADGTKTITITGSFTTLSDYISGGSLSATVVLPNIPRASTVGATDANIGAVSMVAVGRKSPAYIHSIAWQFGALSGYLTADGGVSDTEAKLSVTSIPFKLPSSFYAQIPGAKSGACTLICTTYSGSAQVGQTQSCSFTVTAPEELCKPEVSGTVRDTNTATLAVTGDAAKLVRYMSTALCTISATAKNGASMAVKCIGGTAVTGDTLTIPGVQIGSIEFYASDSRGYSCSKTVESTLIPYVKLTNNAGVERTDPTGGNAVLTLKGDCYQGSFGTGENTLTLQYRVNGGSWVTVTPTVTDNSYAAQVQLSGLDYTQQHTVEAKVSDKLMTAAKTLTVKRGIPVFDWGEEDFTFHVPVVFESGFITKNLTKE